MRLSRTAPLLLCLLALAGARAAGAQEIRSPYRFIERGLSVTPYAGYLWTGSVLTLSDSTEADLGPRSAPVFGARFQARVGGPLAVDVNLGIMPTDRKVYIAEAFRDSTEIRVTDTGRTANALIGMAELGVRFTLTGGRTWNGFAPFIGANGGLAMDLAGSSDAEDDVPETERFDFGPGFAVGVGVGTDWFLTQRFSVRAELQGRLWRLEAPGGFLPRNESDLSEWASASGITLGGSYHF